MATPVTQVEPKQSLVDRARKRVAELPSEIAEVKRKIGDAKEYLRQLDELHLMKIGELNGLKTLLEETGDEGLQLPQGPSTGQA